MVHLLFLLFPFNVLSFKMFQLQHGAIAIDIADYFYSFQLFQFDANGCSMWLFVCVQPQPRIWDEVRECKKNWFTRLLRWFCIVLYYIILNYIIFHFIILYYIIFHFIILYYIIFHFIILYYIIFHFTIILFHIVHYDITNIKSILFALLCFAGALTPGSKSMGGIHREQATGLQVTRHANILSLACRFTKPSKSLRRAF